jgi:hypothetical protein
MKGGESTNAEFLADNFVGFVRTRDVRFRHMANRKKESRRQVYRVREFDAPGLLALVVAKENSWDARLGFWFCGGANVLFVPSGLDLYVSPDVSRDSQKADKAR